jgi:hypothetical protein
MGSPHAPTPTHVQLAGLMVHAGNDGMCVRYPLTHARTNTDDNVGVVMSTTTEKNKKSKKTNKIARDSPGIRVGTGGIARGMVVYLSIDGSFYRSIASLSLSLSVCVWCVCALCDLFLMPGLR